MRQTPWSATSDGVDASGTLAAHNMLQLSMQTVEGVEGRSILEPTRCGERLQARVTLSSRMLGDFRSRCVILCECSDATPAVMSRAMARPRAYQPYLPSLSAVSAALRSP